MSNQEFFQLTTKEKQTVNTKVSKMLKILKVLKKILSRLTTSEEEI